MWFFVSFFVCVFGAFFVGVVVVSFVACYVMVVVGFFVVTIVTETVEGDECDGVAGIVTVALWGMRVLACQSEQGILLVQDE